MGERIRVGVAFGFRSPEHEVSVITGQQVIAALDTTRFEVVPIYVTKAGHWYTGDALLTIQPFRDGTLDLAKLTRVYLPPDPSVRALVPYEKPKLFGGAKSWPLDVVFPCAHGAYGEDGCFQGLLELANLPFVGSGVLGSAVCMDKLLMKAVLGAAGLDQVPYLGFTRSRWERDKDGVLADVARVCGLPAVVKPSACGSSIAVSFARDVASLTRAIDEACAFDRRIVVERAVVDLMEVNCSVMGFEDRARTSVLEQPLRKSELLTFKDKYGDKPPELGGTKGVKGAKGGKTGARAADGSMATADRIIPAPLSDTQAAAVRKAAVSAFQACDCAGVCRVDFLIDRADGHLYVNEVNTLPGSIAFYLWDHELDFVGLTGALVDLALEAHREKQRTQHVFDTALLPGVR